MQITLPELIYFRITAKELSSNAGWYTKDLEDDEQDISGWTYGEYML